MEKKLLISDFYNVLIFPKGGQKGSEVSVMEHADPEAAQNFWAILRLNHELLDYYTQLKAQGLRLAIFSSGNFFKAHAVQGYLVPVFERMISTDDLGIPKSDPASFRTILTNMGVGPHQALFIDDKPENLAGAKAAGIICILFKNTAQAIEEIQKALETSFKKE